MSISLPGILMGFREGLETFLVVAIIIHYLGKLNLHTLKKYVGYGVCTGIVFSFLLGALLTSLGNSFGNTSLMSKMWESIASLAALTLVTTFIVWMINHGRNMAKHIEDQIDSNLSKTGVFLVSTMMVAREGVEIAIFAFAGQYSIESIFAGLFVALALAILIFLSLIKVNLSTVFNITLVYLILQAGYLLGYGLHEGISALKDAGFIAKGSVILLRAFDLSSTVLDNKEGIIGLPLNILLGWYARPEWLQLIAHYCYVTAMFLLLKKHRLTQK